MKQKKQHTTSKEKRRIVLPLFIAFILIFSVFGIMFSGPSATPEVSNTIEHNDYTFTRGDQGWTVPVQGTQITLVYTPFDLQDVVIDPQALVDFKAAQKTYLTRNPAESYYGGERDFFVSLKPFSNLFLACSEESDTCANAPLKTCADASSESLVVAFELDEAALIDYDDHCLTITGDPYHITKAVDAFVLQFFGIL